MRLFVPLLLGIAVLAAGCGESNDDLEREVEALSTEIVTLSTEAAALSDDLADAVDRINALHDELTALAAETERSAAVIDSIDERLRPRVVVSLEIRDGEFVQDANRRTIGMYVSHCARFVEDGSTIIGIGERCRDAIVLFDDQAELDDGLRLRGEAARACYERTVVGEALPACWR